MRLKHAVKIPKLGERSDAAQTARDHVVVSYRGWLSTRKAVQWYFVSALWALIEQGVLVVHHPNDSEVHRVRDVMKTYRDLPCDLADASLVAAAEALGLRQIFTLDSHFYAYRLADTTAFVVQPK